MRNSMLISAIGFAAALIATPAFAQNICNFSYQFADKDWSVLCNALNRPTQTGAFVISDVTYFRDYVMEGNDWCARDEFITYPGTQTKTRRKDPNVRVLSAGSIKGKCKIPDVVPVGQTPPGKGKIQQGLPRIGQQLTKGSGFKEVSDIVIYMDYYTGAKIDVEIEQGNGDKACITADAVRPVALKLNRKKKDAGQAWDQWQLASYEYLTDEKKLPGLGSCAQIRPMAHHGSLPGWTNYDIKPSQLNTGPNRLLQVTYSYDDGSGSPISVSWQQYCKDDALYVQSARAHFWNSDSIDICNCPASSGVCQ